MNEMGLFWVCTLFLCWSSLPNVNGVPTLSEEEYFVCEDVPIGEPAFTLAVNNPDGITLTFSLGGPDQGSFEISSSGTGVVLVKKALDREKQSVMYLLVTISGIVTYNVVVIINDANDNAPIFGQGQYEKTVKEDIAVGSTLLRVQASDLDTSPAGDISYNISASFPLSGGDMFRINRLGDLILVKPLNYTELGSIYRLNVTASDGGGKCYEDTKVYLHGSAFVYITVLDTPDLNPQFVGLPYIESVKEHSAIGVSVESVSAFDPDSGINDQIIYSILDSTEASLFAINEKGVISVNGDIDREKIGDTVNLIVKATEAKLATATSTAPVRITIIDINDNKPEFYQCDDDSNCVPSSSFSGEVQEHSVVPVSINMTVKDADLNAKITLSLAGDGEAFFEVRPAEVPSSTVVLLSVKNPQDLDYEKLQQVTLKVIAVDADDVLLKSTADVTITIIDVNDHSPEFAENTYHANVPEHCADNTTVAEITAVDPDTMDQGKITYSLLPVSIREIFGIEETTGRVFVRNGSLLDRELRSLYSVTLQARDSQGKPGSTVLEVTLTDINDKKPIPNRDNYEQFVSEGENLRVTIEATDGDEPNTPNSQLVFTIEPGPYSMNFTIDPVTGVLTNNGPLDREDIEPDLLGKIELTVNISDKGSPPLSNVVRVTVNVQDVNDNKPVFQKPFYNFTVKESERGLFVGSVYAEDHDQESQFNRISFSIDGGIGSFIIVAVPNPPGFFGNISVDPDIELDYEQRKSFSLEVEAADAQEKATVTVEVHVLDVNDERPRFIQSPPVSVKENSKETEAIGRFEAEDDDTNSSLVFKSVSVTCMCAGEEVLCNWFVVEPNGEVKVNPEAVIDYESCQQATVEAQVVDENTEKGPSDSASPGKMVINIQDVNDNTPQFIESDLVNVLVSESAGASSSVAGVSATDRDSGTNAEIEFKVSKIQFINVNGESSDNPGLFIVETTQQRGVYVGTIQLTSVLDTSLGGKYVVTVEASDKGGLTNSTEVEIFVIDVRYKNELKFRAPHAQIEAQKDAIRSDLTACTQAGVTVTSTRPDTAASTRASDITIMDAYFVFGNGTALLPSNVEKTLSELDNYAIMSKYSLIYVGSVNPIEPETNPALYVLFGIAAGLVIVSVVLSTSLFCTRRNYRRKLKAANAMKSASHVMSGNQTGGPVVPGTNLYTMEGANPVLNLNIDAAIALDLGEDSDVDKISFNSLDNSDMAAEKDTDHIKKKTWADDGDNDSGLPEHVEPLGAALAQRDHRIRSNNPLLGETNPIFDTTDL